MTPSEMFYAYWTLLRKELCRMLRIWIQTLFPPVITITLYFVIFGHLIGSQLKPIYGVSYMNFIIPGLIMMALINNAFMASSSAFYSAKFQRNIDEILITPMPNHLILLGYISGGLLRASIIAMLVSSIAYLFTHIHVAHPLLAILVGLIAASTLSLAGIINAVKAKSFDDISWLPSFVLAPLTYLGGVFYTLDSLSAFWQKIALFNPLYYLVSAFRYAVLGKGPDNFSFTLLILSAVLVSLYAISYRLLTTSPDLRS